MEKYNTITMPLNIEMIQLNLDLENNKKINKNLLLFYDVHTPMNTLYPEKMKSQHLPS